MKSPGSHLVHYVNDGGRCVPALVHNPDSEGKCDMTVFWGPGSLVARFGVVFHMWDREGKMPARSWHHDCPNGDWDE